MTYTLTEHPNTIVRDEDGVQSFIPTDPDNIDYQAYLRFLEEGGVPTPYTPPKALEAQRSVADCGEAYRSSRQ